MDSQVNRLPVVDLLKILAAHLIVFHHLVAYGPLADVVQEAAPDLVSWLYDYGRMAVQVFLVLGGFLAARGFFPDGRPYAGSHGSAVVNRYLRLAAPFLAALALAVAAAALARLAMDEDFVPAAPTLGQTLAHLLFLQDVLGQASLTAGAWYVAIDFQLFVAMIALSCLARRAAASGDRSALTVPGLVVMAMAASLFCFNLFDYMDAWALYFFGAYGMGAATYWALTGSKARRWLTALTALVLLALAIDFRARLAVALATVVVLGLSAGWRRWRLGTELRQLADISYALFLVQFPVLLMANALFARLDEPEAVAGLLAMAATWLVSIGAAMAFHRWVELPARRLRLPQSRQANGHWRRMFLATLRRRAATDAST